MSITKDQVGKFLTDFKQKLNVFSIVFENRAKNRQGLLDLGISPLNRIDYIKGIKINDYISGPNKDTNDTNRSDFWEFGIKVNSNDVYVKISMNKENKPVVCISFHIAEFRLNYKFKKS